MSQSELLYGGISFILILKGLLAIVLGYFIGSINTSVVVSKLIFRDDIRKKGSGNAGLTNMLRTYGKGAAAAVLIGDILKAVVACLLGKIILPSGFENEISSLHTEISYGMMAAGLGTILGHNWPVYFGFKGGKGVLVSITVIFVTNWKIGLVLMGIFLLLVLWKRYVSLGSIAAAIAYPILALFVHKSGIHFAGIDCAYFVFALIAGIIVLTGHIPNIKRLIAGTESKLSFHKNK